MGTQKKSLQRDLLLQALLCGVKKMNEAEKWQRQVALASCGGVCEICGKPLTNSTWQGAHRIANTKSNRKKYGDFIIDSPLNIAIVCSLPCNQSANIGFKTGDCLRLCKRIYEDALKGYSE